MSKTVRTLGLSLTYEIFETHVAPFCVMFYTLSNSKNVHHLVGRREKLEAAARKTKNGLFTKLYEDTVLSKKDFYYTPIFMLPEYMDTINKDGGFNFQSYDFLTSYAPSEWGVLPDPRSKVYLFCGYDMTILEADGSTFAFTSIQDSECWKYYKRKKLDAIIRDETIPIKYQKEYGRLRDSYNVPGNGDMFSWIATLTPEQRMAYHLSKNRSFNKLGAVMDVLGLDGTDFRKEEE